MSLFTILVIVAIILLFTGGFVQALGFLFWVGVILFVAAIISFLFGRSRR
jgi:uncharacterized membrane protein YccF (DUF307 family)